MPINRTSFNKPIVFMLHGFPNTVGIWQRQVKDLQPNAEVILLDFPLHSPKITIDSLIETIVLQVQAAKATSPHSKILFVGHDMGCCLLNEVTCLYPDLVDGQILINGGGICQLGRRMFKIGQLQKSLYVGLFCLPFIAALAQKFSQSIINKVIYRGENDAHRHELVNSQLNSFHHISLYQRLVFYFLSGKSQPMTKTATTFVSGKYDPYLLTPSFKELETFFKRSHQHVLTSGHWSPFTHFNDVNQIIKDHLQTLEAVS